MLYLSERTVSMNMTVILGLGLAIGTLVQMYI